jgi:hypothetical protein
MFSFEILIMSWMRNEVYVGSGYDFFLLKMWAMEIFDINIWYKNLILQQKATLSMSTMWPHPLDRGVARKNF